MKCEADILLGPCRSILQSFQITILLALPAKGVVYH
jgi:hypothetical protein